MAEAAVGGGDILAQPPTVLTVVGMAKNAGKTVTMNYVQNILHQEGRVVGLTSVGRDGEAFDALTNLAKPAVPVQPGSIVATAAGVIGRRGAWDLLEFTGIGTPLGEVLLLRARQAAQVVLAGPGKNSEVCRIVGRLRALGAGCVIVDGAFDRQSAVDPAVSEQVILATGATLSRDIAALTALTKARVEQLSLPVWEPGGAAAGLDRTARLILIDARKTVRTVPVATTLLDRDGWRDLLGRGCLTAIVRGAAGEGLAEALLELATPPEIVVENGGRIFIGSELWRRLRAKQARFRALRAITLLGVTVNPVFPGGAGLDPGALLAAVGAALDPLPVIDVARQRKYCR